MGTHDNQLVQKWIKQKIMFEQATITYRRLAQESSCSADQAREWLQKFCDSDDGLTLKVQLTYLIFGEDKEPVGDCIRASRIERASKTELEVFKSKFHSVSCVQIYSISATQAPDLNLLKSCTKEPISLKPKNVIESYRKESQKDSESNQKSKTDQSKSSTRTGNQESIKASFAVQPKTQTSEGNLAKKDSTSVEVNKKKTESKTALTTLHNKKKTENDKDVRAIDPPQRQHSKNEERKESQTIANKSNGSEQVKSNKKRESEGGKRKEVRSGNETKEEEEASSSRKRVRKTRIIKKKKIIRVKDKKGYRVNREEIEEVEESYSDWESSSKSDSDHESSARKSNKPLTKKKKSSAHLSNSNSKEKKENPPPPNKDNETVKPAMDLPPNRALQQQQPTKKKNPAPVSKEQSNITSFFKKG